MPDTQTYARSMSGLIRNFLNSFGASLYQEKYFIFKGYFRPETGGFPGIGSPRKDLLDRIYCGA